MDIPMTSISCPQCGVLFAIPDDRVTKLKECHNTFYCPSGHSMRYEQQTKSEKIIADLRKIAHEKSETIERLQKVETERLAKLSGKKSRR